MPFARQLKHEVYWETLPIPAHRLHARKGTNAAHKTIQAHISHLKRNRVLHDDIQLVFKLLLDGVILRNVVKVVGKLG